MRERSTTIGNLLLIGLGLPWGYFADGTSRKRGNIRRRRTRYISNADKYLEEYLQGLKGPFHSRVGGVKEILWSEDEESLVFDARVFSMPNKPTQPPAMPPAMPPTREDRDELIQKKCGITEIERKRDILTEVLKISDQSTLTNPQTNQFKALTWLDEVDPAIICPEKKDRINQRYRLALLYYELGGSSWTRCRAAKDATDSDEEKCPGKPFLDKANECEWGGMDCGDSYNDVTAEWLDAYYPLKGFDLASNNLVGEIYDEFYDFRDLTYIAIQENAVLGFLEPFCEARDDSLPQIRADCGGPDPEIICTCCKCY